MAKILLVEDDNNLREIYEARLMAEGYTIVSARDGEEALVVAKAEHPDLVISDVMMPKISGFEMLDILRNTEGLQHVKVIMLTALGQSEDQKRADSLGADRYLVKSQVTLEDIVNVSQTLLQEAGAIAAPEPEPAAAPEPAVAPEPTPAPEPVAAAPMPVPEPVTQPEPSVIPVAAPPADPAPEPQEPVTPAEPVAVAEPPVNPTTAPEPAAAPEPVTTPEPVTEPQTDEPQSSAQEGAAVEQQIADFVASQSGQAPSQVEPSAEPVAVEPEVTQPETEPQTEQQQALDDAAQSLSGERTLLTAPPAAEAATDTPSEPAAPADSDTAGTHKKVIQPLDDDEPNKKSLDELLAEEVARESGAPAPAPTPPAAPPAPSQPPAAPQQPTPPKNPNDFDPNSIAL